jgi:AraC family transcriptional regulator
MYLQEFPNLDWLKNEARKQFASQKDWQGRPLPHRGWPSVVLNVKTNQTYRNNIVGPVSLFGNISGESVVTVGNRDVKVPAGFFFVTNEGQEYTLQINRTTTETFNVHFGTHFAAHAFQSLNANNIEPKNEVAPSEFRNRLFAFDGSVRKLITKIKTGHNEMAEQEILYDLFCHLLRKENEVVKWKENLIVQKKSTRDEVLNVY